MTRSSWIVLLLAVLFAVYVIQAARRLRLNERTVMGWLCISGAIAALAIWRKAIDQISAWMGIYYAPSALFFICCGVLLWLLFRQSLKLSLLEVRVVRLAQEVALASVRPLGESSPQESPSDER